MGHFGEVKYLWVFKVNLNLQIYSSSNISYNKELISHKEIAKMYHIIMYMYTPQNNRSSELCQKYMHACKNCLQSASQHHYTSLLAHQLGVMWQGWVVWRGGAVVVRWSWYGGEVELVQW